MSSSGVLLTKQETKTAQVRNYGLLFGGYFSLAFALFQLSAIWWPPRVVAYMGGPADLSVNQPFLYGILCVVIAAIVALFGLYALSGAGQIRPLPAVRAALITITAVYLLRGLLFIPQLPIVVKNPHLVRFFLFSLIAFCVGAAYLVGVILLYRQSRNEELTR